MIGAEQACAAYTSVLQTPSGAPARPVHALRFLRTDALRQRWPLAIASALMLVGSMTALTVPWLAGELTLNLLDAKAGAFSSSRMIFMLLILVFAVQAVMSAGNGYLLSRTAEHLISSLRVRLYDHLQSLPLAYHQDRRRGDVLSLVTRDVDTLSGYVTGTLVSIAPLVLTFAGAWILMLRIDGFLGFIAGLLVPVFFIIVKLLGRHIRPLAKAVSESHAHAVAVADENLRLLPIIKAYTRERYEAERFNRQSLRVLGLSNRLHLITATLYPVVGFCSASGIVVLIWLASTALAPDALVSFLMYGLLLARPMSGLASTWGETQHARAAADRLNEVFQIQPEPVDSGAAALPPVRGSIVFENVSFAYADRGPVLQGLDLEIAAGETLAITGANGAGKSSLASLLLRFFDPQKGRILIDGHDISGVTLKSLRAHIGLVPQSILLLNGSVRENIAYGQLSPDPRAIEAAAQAARVDAFVRTLPHGYDTLVGEAGVKLSGGQQQRIALARALLADPPILILDEATSMFDPAGEAEFLALTEDIFRERTVLMITHRPASLALADRVVRLEGGRIQRSGDS